MQTRIITSLSAAVLLSGCLSVSPEDEMVLIGEPERVEIDVRDADILELHVPAGEVTIQGDRGDTAHATMTIKCPANSQRCAKWARDARVRAIREGRRVHIGVNQPARLNASVKLAVGLPRHHPVRVYLDYGVLKAQGMQSDVAVKMTAGEVAIEMPGDAVQSVHLAATFGDANLHLLDRAVEGRRPLLVGSKIDWLDGHGVHDVTVNLRFGDIRLELYP